MHTLDTPREKVLSIYNVGDLDRVEDQRFITGRLMLTDYLKKEEFNECLKELTE